MKKISIMIPCYNEVDNVVPMSEAVTCIMKEKLSGYDYEILFIDNCSQDGTREKLELICEKDHRIKAIFNAANFGQFNSPFYGLCQTTGDCAIAMCCDFQDPVELIPVFVEEWEKGHRIVSGIKTSSKENRFIYFLRDMYYKAIRKMSTVQMIEQFTGFGLYDKSFLEILRQLNDPIPFLRGIVAEYGAGFNRVEVQYEQANRRAGKTHNNFYSLYDAAMLSVTSYTKVALRMCTFIGFGFSIISFVIAMVYLIMKLCNWYGFNAGNAPILIGVFMIGSVELLFIGIIGEYILNINTRVINRPIVIEERRLNFDNQSQNAKGGSADFRG